jgi:hypothetical protein
MSVPNASRALDPARAFKPLDFGCDGVMGSVDADGRLIALNTFHEQFGYVTLTTADPFSEEQRYNPAAVRRYRAELATLRGFGPQVPPVARREAFLLADAVPHTRLTLGDGTLAAVTAWAQAGGAVQVWSMDAAFRWRGRLSLQRCAYTQLTEGGPVPMPPVESHVRFDGQVLTVENPALKWAAAIAGFPPGSSWEQIADGPVEVDLQGQPGTTTLTYGFGPDAAAAHEAALRIAQTVPSSLQTSLDFWHEHLASVPENLLIRRGLTYGLMLAVPVGETRCILTDHMLLPLSWNRDAYYVARALLKWHPALADVVRRHVLWMFEVADRPAGVWGRCYLANGRLKDGAFQLDQQLYPLLELADYVRQTGDSTTWDRLRPRVRPVIEMLLARKAPHAWLIPTDETPADDPLVLPYHLSSHILMWHTLRQIAQLTDDAHWLAITESIREAVLAHFVADFHGQTLYAYATDGAGRFHFYHDANDFPLALAPAWGFLPDTDPIWRATLDFAFSDANTGGCYAGRLGSVHTPAPWPLGDIQDVIIARALQDGERERRAWDRLNRAAQWDGALPEAGDPDTGDVVSRHWFAWPNAALACVALGVFDNPY